MRNDVYDPKKALEIQRLINIRKAQSSLWAYCCLISPDFYKPDRWHLWLICECLQALYERRLDKHTFYLLCTDDIVPKWYKDTIDWDNIADDIIFTRLMMNIAPRHGKCIKEGSLVKMYDGTYKKIEDVQVGEYVSTFKEDDFTFTKSKVLNRFDNGVKPIVKIKLFSGREIYCTNNHPLYTINGWTAAENLNIGDKLICQKKANIPCNKQLPYGYAKIMGYMVGDGCYSKGYHFGWSKGEEAVINDMKSCLEYHNWALTKTSKYGFCVTSGAKEEYYPNKKTPYSEFNKYLGTKGSYTKEVPEIILNSNEKDISDFLGAYFSCDGTVSKCRGGLVEYYSVSKKLLKQVQTLLTMFGIFSTLRIKKGKYNGNSHLSFRLSITGKDIITFMEKINVVGKKAEQLNKIVPEIKQRRNFPEYESIPKDWKKLGLKHKDWYYKKNIHVAIDKQFKIGTAKQVVKKVAEFDDNDVLRKICSDEIVWDRIMSIEVGEEAQTYDIEIDNTHNFLIDNVVVHNSRTLINFCDWILGESTQNKIITVSYNTDLASDMSRYVRDGIMMKKNLPTQIVYSDIFPNSKIARGNSSFMKWALEGSFFNYLGAGLEGTITGKGGNVTIIDDPIKNAEESYNDRVLDGIWNWYTGTFLSRAEKEGAGSIDIINHTRWNTKDLCGRIIDGKLGHKWLKLSFPVEYEGEMLCESILPKEDFKDLVDNMDPNILRANYYQEPIDIKGRLFDKFITYDELPDNIEKVIAYVDTADAGTDYLSCIIGAVKEGEVYITDIYFTQDDMTITEGETARHLVINNVNTAKIESNNGGKGFARNVEKKIWEIYKKRDISITWFHQTENKLARILTGATYAMEHIFFPKDWIKKYPDFYLQLMSFQKSGNNKHDDAAESLVEFGKMVSGDGTVNAFLELMKEKTKKA